MNKEKMSHRKIERYSNKIIHNFKLSVIMPFFRRLDSFKKVIKKNAPYLQRNGIEVIIVLDSPEDEVLLVRLIKKYPFINWKLIVNDTPHEPRNPAKVLNVGIRHATKKYILISDPEVEFYTDVIFQLRNLLENYPNHYALGTVAFVEEDDEITKESEDKLWFLNYGSIMVEKQYLETIGGYDESFEKWGGEDDNIRKRLDMQGTKKLLVPEARSLHREKKLKLSERLNRTHNFPAQVLKKMYYPKDVFVNKSDWGNEFNRIGYDWQNNKYAEELCKEYLTKFIKYDIKPSVFSSTYKKLILAQSYNELEFLDGFLEDMSNYFDGIILLDDSSKDGTYEQAIHEKLLLKVQKKRQGFNDLENRNILLDLASFFKTEWLCFMDIDERFDPRYSDFDRITSNHWIDAAGFKFVNLWDNMQMYNASIPFSFDGIWLRDRMFRNIGRTQIITTQKKLHFSTTPLKAKKWDAPILVLHLGHISKERRINKYNFYQKEDTHKDQLTYEYLMDESPTLVHINEISF